MPAQLKDSFEGSRFWQEVKARVDGRLRQSGAPWDILLRPRAGPGNDVYLFFDRAVSAFTFALPGGAARSRTPAAIADFVVRLAEQLMIGGGRLETPPATGRRAG